MTQPKPTSAVTLSHDQAEAFDQISAILKGAGVDLDDSLLMPPKGAASAVAAVMGKAGSGKTLLLSELVKALQDAGVSIVSGDYESKKALDRAADAMAAIDQSLAGGAATRTEPGPSVWPGALKLRLGPAAPTA